MSIYKKLAIIQSRVNGLGKDKKAHGYDYVTGSKVLSEIKPIMNELGLLLKQEVLSIENERQDYKTGIGTQYEKPKSEILSKVMMRFTWVDSETGEKDENLFGANGQNDWDKGVGSAITYAERYFLLKFFHIATDEDDIDNPDRAPKVPETKPTPAKKETVKTDPTSTKKDGSLDADKTKALEALNKLDTAMVLKELIGTHKLRYTDVKSFVAGESIERIREIYTQLTAKK